MVAWISFFVFRKANSDEIEHQWDYPLGNGELGGQDLAFAEMIYKRQGIMGTISLLQEGDRCKIADPAWEEIHGTVVKMDFGRKRCCIEFEFERIRRKIWVGYELIRQDLNKNNF